MESTFAEIVSQQAEWWEEPRGEVHKALLDRVEAIEKEQPHISEENLYHARLYSNRNELGISWGARSRGTNTAGIYDNVTKQVIDTVTSIIGRNHVRARVITTGGHFTEERKAKQLEKLVWGEFVARGVYDKNPRILRDGCIFGTGAIKLFKNGRKLDYERVLIDHIVVDERECLTSMVPQEIHYRVPMDRRVLAARFPSFRDEIMNAASRTEWAAMREVPAHMVVVVETHRRALDGMPGRHCIVVDGATLFDEKWPHEWFPYVFYRWSDPLTGFYGEGIVKEVLDLQVRVNQIDRFIQLCQDRIAVPRVYVDSASATLKVMINDEIGAIIPYRGKPPVFHTPQALTAEIYNYRRELGQRFFERVGLNQLTAQSGVPAGIESGVAMRELTQIPKDRLSVQAIAWENYQKELGHRTVDMARRIYKGQGERAVFTSHNVLEHIDWADVDMEDDRFVMTIEAASILTMTPAFRFQAAVDLAQAQVISPHEFRRLLNHPDIEREDTLELADERDIDDSLERILAGKFQSPEPLQNLPYGVKRFTQAFNLYRNAEDVPASVLDDLQTWISQAQAIMDQAASGGQAAALPPEPGIATGEVPVDAATQAPLGQEQALAPMGALGPPQ